MEEIVVLRTNAESGNLLLHDNALFYIKPETEFLSLSLSVINMERTAVGGGHRA